MKRETDLGDDVGGVALVEAVPDRWGEVAVAMTRCRRVLEINHKRAREAEKEKIS